MVDEKPFQVILILILHILLGMCVRVRVCVSDVRNIKEGALGSRLMVTSG